MINRPFGSSALSGIGLVAAGLLFAAPAQAQQADARWLPFVGCWEAVGAEDDIGLLCFAPSEGGVLLTNVVNGEVASTERLVADGRQRPINAEGCDGWESVEFSADGRRAFTTTEFTCAEGEARSGTGVMAFTAPNFWVDVRELDIDGEKVAWVQEYLLADAETLAEAGVADPAAEMRMAVRTARLAAAAELQLDDVEEATRVMGDRAVETWIVAHRTSFDLDADALVGLDEAGVSDRVIDALVAVSYPDRFMVEAGSPAEQMEGAPRPTHYRGYMGYNPWFGSSFGFAYDSWGYSPFHRYRWSPYSRYGYSAFGYPYGYGYGYGYGYWGSRPGVVIINRRPPDGGGRLYQGQGYRPRSTATPSGRNARPRGNAVPSFGRGSAGSGSAAPSRTGTTRTAKPRGARRRSGGR